MGLQTYSNQVGFAPACCCHSYAGSGAERLCVELCIEGVVQGAFTWAFTKALIACHLEGTIVEHTRAMLGIITDLQGHVQGFSQFPGAQLGGDATSHDLVLLS